MTVQMREGWVLCRNGDVGFARLTRTTDHWPWSFGKWTFRNDGTQSFFRDCKSEHDVVELLDPWDYRVPEAHREKRFVVGTFGSDGQEYPCVFDRAEMVGAGFTVSYLGDDIERVACQCNADFESGGGKLPFSWSPKHMLTIDGKPCNPDGSPIAEEPKPVDEPVPAAEPEPLTYKLGDRGVTRDGREAECWRECEHPIYPLDWKLAGECRSKRQWASTRDGSYYYAAGESANDIIRRIDDATTSHGPQRGPADLSRIRAQVAQTRRDLADAIDSLRANLRVLDGVDAELNAEQSSATTDATTEGGA